MNRYLPLSFDSNILRGHKRRSIIGGALCAIVLSCFTGSVSAQSAEEDGAGDTEAATLSTTMNWSDLAYVGGGYRSSTAMHYSGMVVEVHDSTGALWSTGLYYHIGKLDATGTKVTWSPSKHIPGKPNPKPKPGCYCAPVYPSVAITNEGYVIVTYSLGKNKKDSTLNYRVGTLNLNGDLEQKIQWKTDIETFDSGYHGTIAVNASGVIAEAHESGSGGKGIYYRLGHLTDPAGGDFHIIWDTGDEGQWYSNGINPHISINDSGEVVEVHQVASNDHKLHYIRGKLKAKSIEFNASQPKYNNNGQRPAVVLLNNGSLVELHDNGSSVYYRTGQLDSKDASKINWSETQPIPKGKDHESNSVSSNGVYALATAYDDFYTAIRYSVSVAP